MNVTPQKVFSLQAYLQIFGHIFLLYCPSCYISDQSRICWFGHLLVFSYPQGFRKEMFQKTAGMTG
jgi:hypothetical protein